jgi:Rieske Fe-S protein
MTQQLTRRSAMRGAAVVVLGGIVGFAVARNSAAAKDKAGTTAANAYGASLSSHGRRLVSLAAIPVGGAKILSGVRVVVVRTGPEAVHAFSATCTHQGCEVTQVRNGTIDCPCHGSKFDLATGKVVAGPAPAPLPPVAVTVRGGEVYEQ